MRIIATVPIRNEAWILPTFLAALEQVADAIIIGDQRSTDASRDICRGFAKVTLVTNEGVGYDEGIRQQVVLDAARDFEGDNLILTLDADEVFTGNALESDVLDALSQRLAPGEAAEGQWLWLWKDARYYRYDGAAFTNNWHHFAYRDDRRIRFTEGRFHRSRVPDIGLRRTLRFEQPKVLHLQFADWHRAMAKQRWYRCIEQVAQPDKSAEAINLQYAWFMRGMNHPRLLPVAEAWVAPWRERGVDPLAFRREDLVWYEVEVLQLFRQYGTRRFADLDIWDTDWERIRQRAVAAGCDGVPETPIGDPRGLEQRLAQAFTRRTLLVPPWRRLPRAG